MLIVAEVAISLHFKVYSDRQDKAIDSRTGIEHDLSDIDTKILIYEDRVFGWFLEYVKKLQSEHDAGFLVLQIAISQIEGMEQYRQGSSSNNKSKKVFSDAMKRIFGIIDIEDKILCEFYDLVRCGLFHDGMTRANVYISNNHSVAIEFKDDLTYINPNKFLDKVIADFENYILELKNPENIELRDKFEKMFI